MKIKTTKTETGATIKSWNDSNTEWVVTSDTNTEQRFPKNKWTQKEAIEFYARINGL